MLYEDPDKLSNGEKEILLLKAVMDSIGSMVNHSVLTLNHNDPDSSIQFKTEIHQRYFNIILVDFLSIQTFVPRDSDLFKQLQNICKQPCYSKCTKTLESAVNDFQNWLTENVKLEHNGKIRDFWFPSINKEISLQITRLEYIKICGNISKHNPLGLNRQAKIIKKIFSRNKIKINIVDSLLIVGEFYEQFHDDLFNYHSSTIAEFLNNLRWAIYEYLQPLYKQAYNHQDGTYFYSYPKDITNRYVREVFWSLMNDIRSEPYMPKFLVTRFLKIRY